MFNAGGDTSDSFVVWRLSFRNVQWMQQAVAAALALLTDEYRWNASPTVNAETAADFGIEVTLSFLPASNIVGSILAFAGIAANIPPATLLCDGASYLRSDYPDLFAAIGTIWGAADGTHFNVPDARSVALIGAGQQSPFSNRVLASLVGEESHTLTGGEMPTHTHTESTATPSVADILIPSGPSAIAGAGITGAAGGGGAHNNMQPSVAVTFLIVARSA